MMVGHNMLSTRPAGVRDQARRWRRLLAGAAAVVVGVPLAAVAAMTPAAADAGGPLGPWEWRNQLPQGNHLSGVDFIDAGTGTAVGAFGTILRTTDGGATWVAQANPVTDADTGVSLSGVDFTDADHGVAVGLGGTVLYTSTGGQTWDAAAVPGGTGSLTGVSFADAGTGWAVGPADGACRVVRSTDGGASWQDVSPDCAGDFSAHDLAGVFAVTADVVVAVGNPGTVVRSDDGGASWTLLAERGDLPPGAPARLNGVFFIAPDTGWIVGRDGFIAGTVDGGASWTTLPTGVTSELRTVTFTDQATGWVTGADGTVLHTSDGGASWVAEQVTGSALAAGSFPTPDVGTVVGANGTIVRTTDGGDTWTQQSRSVTLTNLQGVAFAPGSDTGLAVGLQGMVLRTTDAGDTWTGLDSPASDTTLEDVALLDPNTAIAVGGTGAGTPGAVLRTTDGGASWQRHDGLGSGRLRGVSCADAATCMAVSVLGGVVRTTDGGQSWVDVSPPADIFPAGSSRNLESVSCPEPDVCVVVGWDGVGIRTSDGGQSSWQLLDTGPSTSRLEDVVFVDPDTGWVAGANGALLHTTDGGATWDETDLTPARGGTPQYQGVSFADENTGTVVGSSGDTWHTTDGGATWTEEKRRTNAALTAVAHLDTDTAVAVGNTGTILKRVDTVDPDPDPDPDPVPSEESQDIIATIPDTPGDGSLVLSVDPDDRTVTLPELANAGDRLATSGGLRPVTVTDTRAAANPGWDASAQVSDFTGDAGSFGGGYLGWTPSVASQSGGQTVTAGGAVAPGFPTGDGLAVPQTLATAPSGAGVGTAVLGAGLDLEVPTTTEPGTYTAVLILTAI